MNPPEILEESPHRWTQQHPELGTGPLPHEPNISAEYFEKEREKLFKQTWLMLCRADEVPNVGSYKVMQMDMLETSVLLVRGEDNVVRAFHNSCPHRGNKVVMAEGEKSGEDKGFVCGFHGWTYDLEGRLTHVVDEDSFFDLDKCKLGLKPIHCVPWNGFIFINIMDTPKVPLEEALGEWGRELSAFPFDKFELVNVHTANVRCNWKIALDAFQEGYHALTLHGKTAGAAFSSKQNKFAHLLAVDLFEEGHRRASMPANLDFRPPPAVQLAVKYIGHNVYSHADDMNHKIGGANPSGIREWGFDINVVFPNVMMALMETAFVTHHFWPISVDETLWEAHVYQPISTSVIGRIAQQNSEAAVRDVHREDLVTLENTQTVLRSGAITQMQLSDSEILVRHSYKKIDEWVNA